MTFLVILKRFEVWLLLAIVIALVVYAFQPPPPLPGSSTATSVIDAADAEPVSKDPANPATGTPAPSPSLVVREVKMFPSSPGFIVETLIAGGSGRDKDLPLSDDQVRATTGDGQPVNRFFEPFQTTPVLLASGDGTASLRWWLPAPTDSLWIEIGGERIQAELP